MLPRKIFDSMLDEFNYEDKMKCDIYEKNEKYHIEVDVPGFNKEDIKIECNKGNLVIVAEKNEEEKDMDKKYLCKERKIYGKYQRTIYLGEVDEENIEASFKNGILKITVPKKPEEDTRKIIEIKGA